jgi:hypothetical protein
VSTDTTQAANSKIAITVKASRKLAWAIYISQPASSS